MRRGADLVWETWWSSVALGLGHIQHSMHLESLGQTLLLGRYATPAGKKMFCARESGFIPFLNGVL